MAVIESELVKPNLYLVGFQKCGSSSLFDYMESHPKITGTFPKETFMLCNSDSPMFQKRFHQVERGNWSPYFNLNGKNPNEIKYFMEGSVCNVNQDYALNEISKQDFKKVIFILRNPIDRFISTYTYRKRNIITKYGNIDINEYLNFVLERKFEHDDICQNAIESGKYDTYISKWMSRIDVNETFIVGMNELKNLQSLSNKLCKFLNLSDEFTNEIRVKNKTYAIRNSKLQLLASRFYPYIPKGKARKLIGRCLNQINSSHRSINNRTLIELSTSNLDFLKETYKSEFEKYGQFF